MRSKLPRLGSLSPKSSRSSTSSSSVMTYGSLRSRNRMSRSISRRASVRICRKLFSECARATCWAASLVMCCKGAIGQRPRSWRASRTRVPVASFRDSLADVLLAIQAARLVASRSIDLCRKSRNHDSDRQPGRRVEPKNSKPDVGQLTSFRCGLSYSGAILPEANGDAA